MESPPPEKGETLGFPALQDIAATVNNKVYTSDLVARTNAPIASFALGVT